MSVCRDCAFWQYNFPHVAGVCTVGPRDILGSRSPISVELVGDLLAHEYEACVATYPNSTCIEWEPQDEKVEDIPYIDEDGKAMSFFDEDE